MTKRRTLQEQVVFVHRPRRRHFAVTYRRLALRRASSRKPSCLISLAKSGKDRKRHNMAPIIFSTRRPESNRICG
jgi:hypothetical protein